MAEYYGIEEKIGVLVIEVFPGDPADMAGVKPKDIILSVNGKKVSTARELTGVIADIGVGDTARMKVLRNGATKTFKVKIAKREDAKVSARRTPKEHKDEMGIRVKELTPELARRFNIKETGGVIVAGVEPGSKAAESGLRVHDIIKEVNHRNITTVNEFNKAISKTKDGETINLFIRRMNSGFLVIKITK